MHQLDIAAHTIVRVYNTQKFSRFLIYIHILTDCESENCERVSQIFQNSFFAERDEDWRYVMVRGESDFDLFQELFDCQFRGK